MIAEIPNQPLDATRRRRGRLRPPEGAATRGSPDCKLLSRRSRGAVWPSTRPCQGRDRRFESGRDRQSPPRRAWRGGRAWLKATVSKTVIGATLSWVRIPPSPPNPNTNRPPVILTGSPVWCRQKPPVRCDPRSLPKPPGRVTVHSIGRTKAAAADRVAGLGVGGTRGPRLLAVQHPWPPSRSRPS